MRLVDPFLKSLRSALAARGLKMSDATLVEFLAVSAIQAREHLVRTGAWKLCGFGGFFMDGARVRFMPGSAFNRAINGAERDRVEAERSIDRSVARSRDAVFKFFDTAKGELL